MVDLREFEKKYRKKKRKSDVWLPSVGSGRERACSAIFKGGVCFFEAILMVFSMNYFYKFDFKNKLMRKTWVMCFLFGPQQPFFPTNVPLMQSKNVQHSKLVRKNSSPRTLLELGSFQEWQALFTSGPPSFT